MNPQAAASFFLLLAAGLGSATASPQVECALGCTMDFDPVCSFDGLMYTQYPNSCQLGIASCNLVSSGKAALVQKVCPKKQDLCGDKYYCGHSQACVLDRIRSVTYCAAMCDANTCKKDSKVCIMQEDTSCVGAPCPTKETCVPHLENQESLTP
ncbi:hypothetical protein Gpo141_00004959 [Globisporangium polare]